MRLKTYVRLLPLLIACGCGLLDSTEDLYRKSEMLWRYGNVQEAMGVADRGLQKWKSRPDSEWHWKFRLLKAELLLNQGLRARAQELLEGSGGTPPPEGLKARYLADLGQVRRDRALVDRAFELASRQGLSSLIPAIELKRAALDSNSGRSEALVQNALNLARAQSDTFLETAALLDLGFKRLSASRFDEAIPWLERAESSAHRSRAVRMRERALGNLGLCYYRLGDFDRAVDSLSLAISLAREVADDFTLHRWVNNL